MAIMIKPIETDEEARGRGYVHWKAWQETYPGLVDPGYLEWFTLEKAIAKALAFRDGLLIAKDGDRVVGFVGIGLSRDADLPETGEVFCLYLLKEYYDQKIGYGLMCSALEQMPECQRFVLWVLKGNERAIRFYQKFGFRFDGVSQEITLGTPNTELRMIFTR